MTLLHSITGVTDSTIFRNTHEIPLPDVYATRPMVRVPRSAQREYTDSELSTAAAMIAKMRLRHDVIDELKKHGEPLAMNDDQALDIVIEKLLDLA